VLLVCRIEIDAAIDERGPGVFRRYAQGLLIKE
jgi:hypothetical protein